MNAITIIGSINLDTNLRVKKIPRPGETVAALEHYSAGGGKGANQALAAKRAGCQTFFIGAVGNDNVGKQMKQLLTLEEIDSNGIMTQDNATTGQAFITVDEHGENTITMYAGANESFTPEDVRKNSTIIQQSDVIVAQFESPIDSTIEAFTIAQQNGVKTILNPAPAEKIPQELFTNSDLIVPNETETEVITGISVNDEASAKKAAEKLHNKGVAAVVITMGSKGVFYDFAGKQGLVPAITVTAADTTAAGDTFIGTMCKTLKRDFSNLEEAVTYGNIASSLTVQRYGAQPSIPYKNEIDTQVEQQNKN